MILPTMPTLRQNHEDFYDQLQSVVEAVPGHDLLIVMGDWKGRSSMQEMEEKTIVKHPLSRGVRNDDGERFFNFYAMKDLVITSTVFPHRDI